MLEIERFLRIIADSNDMLDDNEDRLLNKITSLAPKPNELEDTDLEFVTAAKGKTYYDQLFQQGKTDGKK